MQKGKLIRRERIMIIGSVGVELVEVMSYNCHKYIPWEDISGVDLGSFLAFIFALIGAISPNMPNFFFFRLISWKT